MQVTKVKKSGDQRHEPDRPVCLQLLEHIRGGEHQHHGGDILDAVLKAEKQKVAQRRAQRAEQSSNAAARLCHGCDPERTAAVQQRHRRKHHAKDKIQSPANHLRKLRLLLRQFPVHELFPKPGEFCLEFHCAFLPRIRFT